MMHGRANTETHSEPNQTFKMELSSKIRFLTGSSIRPCIKDKFNIILDRNLCRV